MIKMMNKKIRIILIVEAKFKISKGFIFLICYDKSN
jgi:hypothetical protein